MSIILKTLVIDGIGTECKLVMLTTAESFAQFAKLVDAGASLDPNLPANVKQFVDMVTSGKVLQDYYSQDQKAPESVYEQSIFVMSNLNKPE